MSGQTILRARRIFDGEAWHDDSALVMQGDTVKAILPASQTPAGAIEAGDILAPGFVDLQVNGGGGVMLNDHPTTEGIETICRAHAPFGTTSLLPTLITDTREVTAAAIAAGIEAARRRVPGFAGLHMEGPHLSIARKGAHDPQLIRPMEEADIGKLIEARRKLPTLVSTVAVESVSPEQVSRLASAGIIVSLGHTEASFAQASAYAAAGATMATHLFNAMSQIGNREPGLAGAVLGLGSLSAGLIADGIHVDPVTMGIALRAKSGPGQIFLVTDAMATLGTDMTSFTLNGRTIHRRDGRLTLADGTLAGADLDMISAVRLVHRRLGVELGAALAMATLDPARAIGRDDRLGRLRPGSAADIVALSDRLEVNSVWIGGETAFAA